MYDDKGEVGNETQQSMNKDEKKHNQSKRGKSCLDVVGGVAESSMTRQNKSDRSNTVRKRVLSRLTASCVGWMPCFQVLLTPPAPRPCVELTPIVTAANAQGFAVLLHTQPINQPVKHEQNNSGASKQEIKG